MFKKFQSKQLKQDGNDDTNLAAAILKSSDDAIEGLGLDGTVKLWNKGA